jgi:hypothetical protein
MILTDRTTPRVDRETSSESSPHPRPDPAPVREGPPRFFLEIPIHSVPLSRLVEIEDRHPVSFILYGGFPDSPLNGGRANFSLDGSVTRQDGTVALSPETLAAARRRFFATVKEANRRGIAFLLAFTNMLVCEEELTADNLAPVEWIARTGSRHGVLNGVIVNSPALERRLRSSYGRDLQYVSSCTRYFRKDRILSPAETTELYIADSQRYDLVVVTPQDSRRKRVLAALSKKIPNRFAAISNSYCADDCNSFHHYLATSEENKKSLLEYGFSDVLDVANRVCAHYPSCPVATGGVERLDVRRTTRVQLSTGVTHFKVGRGIGEDGFDDVVGLLTSCRGEVVSA